MLVIGTLMLCRVLSMGYHCYRQSTTVLPGLLPCLTQLLTMPDRLPPCIGLLSSSMAAVSAYLQCIQLPIQPAELAAHGVCCHVGLLHCQHACQT
jgi:hypothetical protein